MIPQFLSKDKTTVYPAYKKIGDLFQRFHGPKTNRYGFMNSGETSFAFATKEF